MNISHWASHVLQGDATLVRPDASTDLSRAAGLSRAGLGRDPLGGSGTGWRPKTSSDKFDGVTVQVSLYDDVKTKLMDSNLSLRVNFRFAIGKLKFYVGNRR